MNISDDEIPILQKAGHKAKAVNDCIDIIGLSAANGKLTMATNG